MAEIRVAVLLSLLFHAALALVMVFNYATRKTYPGFRSWTSALVCWELGGLCLFLRPLASPLFSVVTNNAFFLASSMLIYGGLARFYGFDPEKRRQRQNMLFSSLMLGLVLFFLLVEDSLNMRILVNSLAIAVLSMRSAIDPLRYAKKRYRPQQWVISAALLGLVGMMLARGVYAAAVPPMEGSMPRDPMLIPLLASSVFCLSLVVFGMIALTNCRLEGELLAAQAIMRERAERDALTGLWNRSRFTELAEHDMRQAKRYGHKLSAILFDLDNFKQVNDTFGHAAGDNVLRAVGQLCRVELRDVDIPARWGGEEFVVLMPHTGLGGARETAERLRVHLKNITVDGATGDAAMHVTASFGVATMDENDLEELLLRADACLYEAKNAGRDRVCVAAGC